MMIDLCVGLQQALQAAAYLAARAQRDHLTRAAQAGGPSAADTAQLALLADGLAACAERLQRAIVNHGRLA